MSIKRVQKALELIQEYRAKPHTKVRNVIDAEAELHGALHDLQSLAEDLRRDCCNSSCHLDDTLKKLKGE